jgi:DNA polymerase III subunit epsilon
MDFVAIDFETANRQPDSACQLAAVVVRDSRITHEHSWLIRPPSMYFAPMNIAVHGIRPDDVRHCPTMENVWGELAPLLDGQLVIAHNARFDIGVLVHSLAAHDIACPALDFQCTRTLARAAWPGKSSYGLKPLGNWLGIQFKHHDALEDSRCCARIALAVEQTVGQSDVAGLEAALRIGRGHYAQGVVRGPKMLPRRGAAKATGSATTVGITDRRGFPTSPARRQLGGIDAGTVLAAAGDQLPFAGKRIVMLGPLRGLDVPQTVELLKQLGAEVQTAISPQTDFVVACGTSLDDAQATVQQSQTLEVREEGMPPNNAARTGIRVLSERQFRMLLPAGQSSVRW